MKSIIIRTRFFLSSPDQHWVPGSSDNEKQPTVHSRTGSLSLDTSGELQLPLTLLRPTLLLRTIHFSESAVPFVLSLSLSLFRWRVRNRSFCLICSHRKTTAASNVKHLFPFVLPRQCYGEGSVSLSLKWTKLWKDKRKNEHRGNAITPFLNIHGNI